MTWRVQWSAEALKDIRRLDMAVRQRILAALDRFAETGHGDVVRLQPPLNDMRLRVGDWRVRFAYDPDGGTIEVLHVKHHRESYRGT